MNKNYRIHTNIISDTLLHVNMRQDFDFMEILSLKLSQKDAYKIHSSNYGVIIGRVLANDAFGIPNAKISVFIERDDNDTTDMENIYPYKDVNSKDKEGRRYNLLPDDSDDECYRIVGTFPNKRLLLDDNTYLEVYDKYWKYSTVTNNAGDYMIFGIPSGSQQIHVDIDMSDIGILSQKPRDYMYKGYTETLFDSSTQFKKSTNLDNLTQIFSQNKSVFVYPFWGDSNNGIAAITRADIQINYKFEPTCVFMGSIVSDNDGNSINHKCGATQKSGFNRQLVAGEGTIEMIRKTQDGLVEEYPIQGNRLIDSDGVWCYQIPMNLDYVGTDEYGNIVPTDNPSKGIPTRTQVRFRISKTETGDEGTSNHTAKYLVPMNPILNEDKVEPTTEETTGQEMERMYNFGSNTPQSCFRDLYWNNVYSVKNFIPKTQTAKRGYSPYYNALKACNAVDNQNPIPFNKLMINIPFTYMFICLLFTIVITIINVVNKMINLLNEIIKLINGFLNLKIFGIRIFRFGRIGYIGCVPMQAGTNSDNKVYYPGCNKNGMDAADCPEDMDSCKKVNDKEELMDVIQQNLSQEYDVVRLDLYQDWLNGCLYMPLWFWKKPKKKKFLFGLFSIIGKNQFCDCDKEYSRLKTKVTCNIVYDNKSLRTTRDSVDLSEDKWHKTRDKSVGFRNGLIKRVENNSGEMVYYYTGFQPSNDGNSKTSSITQIKSRFKIVRLFATDIILLGNLNESNIYGIPQLFKRLPSTTSNIPPIATIEESDTDETEKTNENNDMYDNDETGSTVVTGMDWGHSGADDSPIYKNGLFLDLACLYADTKSKACINVERMSELGVGLDMSYKMAYAKGNDIVEGVIDSDGFINKFEINDNEARAMFSTLNHIGFVPQDYQDDKEMYETQVNDDNTNYLVPKFKYIYPVDFDGRMKPIMDDYGNGFTQPLFDNTDESYLTFRFGAEKNNRPSENSEGRIRHFYYNTGGKYEMPLYNNSFYFYFGINKGNTAIDKFTSKFVAPCAKDSKKPFTILTETQGKVECKEIYNISGFTVPYIKVSVDDIQVPYSYELLDSSNNTVVAEANKVETEFIIPDDKSKITSGIEISNQTYTIKVTDGNGKKQTERIIVSTPSVSIDCDTEKLGTKFYNTDTTRVDYICSSDTTFYGKIKIKSFYIDGYKFDITNAEPLAYDIVDDYYSISVSGTNDSEYEDEKIFDVSGASINIQITSINSSVHECLCDEDNPILGPGVQLDMDWCKYIPTSTTETGEIVDASVEIYVYKPNSYMLTISQMCPDPESESLVVVTSNTSNEIVTVQNGEVFNAYLNRMPLRFMVGTISDSKSGTIMNQSNFYRTDVVTSPTGAGLNGWYGVHQEDTYKFLEAIPKNASIWGDYITLNDMISNHDVKKKILKYKFETMFSVAESTYVTTSSSDRYSFHSQGGVGVPLNRAVYPVYDEATLTKKVRNNQYVLTDRSTVNGSTNYPNIVGSNYRRYKEKVAVPSGPLFNEFIKTDNEDTGHTIQGNYVAVFSNNGGYVTNTRIDPKKPVIKLPNYTAITPKNGGSDNPKKLGKDEKGQLNMFNLVHTKDGTNSLPYLRTMFVDRRLDFDLVIFAPVTEQKLKLYPYEVIPETEETEEKIIEDPRESIWRNSRISGVTYGGIEMAYDSDDEYNILSADTTGDSFSSATRNNMLEYSCSYSDNPGEDAKTYFNENPERKRMLYEATLNGEDIRDCFWSKNKKDYIWNEKEFEIKVGSDISYVTMSSDAYVITAATNGYYFKYPYTTTGLYNGDFSRNTVSENYPTKRFIDVGNLPARAGSSELLLTSCSYDTKPVIDGSTGEMKMTTTAGESIEIQFGFENFLTMISPNSENMSFGNIVYEDYDSLGSGWYVTNASIINPVFRINPYENDGFNIYNHSPRIIKVLPYTKHNGVDYDGISYIKLACPSSSEGVNKALDYAIDDVTLYNFGRAHPSHRTFKKGCIRVVDTITHEEEVSYTDELHLKNGMVIEYDGSECRNWNYFLKYDENDDPVPSNATTYNNIEFDKELSFDENVKVFTILLQREYESIDDDNLTKHVRTLETSSLFDARPLQFAIDDENTYVMYEVFAEETESEETESDETSSVSSQTFTQTFGVKFRIKENETNPLNKQNEGFANVDTMSYTFIFGNEIPSVIGTLTTDVYQIPVTNVTYTPSTDGDPFGYLSLSAKWTEDMGIALDNKWNRIALTILGKTREGFVYKLNDLQLACDGFADSGVRYYPDSKTGEGFEANKAYKIKMRFK